MRLSRRTDDGAAAVEFALIVPVLVALAAGIIDFGYRYQQHVQYTNAAMQSARVMAIKNNQSDALAAARAASDNAAASIAVSTGGCAVGHDTVSVTVSGTRNTLTGLFGQTFTVSGKGQVRCE